MTPTAEQLAIIEAATKTSDNLLVSALAGAAKTSTLVMVAEALPRVAALCLAFNKRIATEMQERLPPNCVAMTLNSLGHKVWGQTVSKGLRVNKDKMYGILSDLVKDLKGNDKEEAFATFSDTLQAIEWGKISGYVPTGRFPVAKRLMDDEVFFAELETEPTDLQQYLIKTATYESIKQGYEGIIDFNDQILLPTVFPCSFPQYPLVLVDEAQDLSPLNHATLKKLVKKRLIAVGDRCQSIYGFRGADEASMDTLQKTFNMVELTLSISFRCPRSIIEEARWRAPTMQWPEWAIEGTVKRLAMWGTEDLPTVATILCRNNAPIFKVAIELLKNGRYAEIVGNEIGKNLIKTLKKLGPSYIKQAQVLDAIDAWERAKLAKSRRKGKVMDTAECLRVFARAGATLLDAIGYAEHVLSATGSIQMMTGHKAKGLEFQNVFILDSGLINRADPQDENLLYVMQTRSKESLTYIHSEGFESKD